MQLERVPMYLADLRFGTERVQDGDDQTARRIVIPVFRIEPFTRELAGKITPGSVSKLFDLHGGEPAAEFERVEVNIASPLVTLQLRQADDTTPSATIADVRLGKRVAIRRDKETPTYAATLRLNFAYPSAKDLLFLAHALNQQLLVSLVEQQIKLNLEAEDATTDDDQEPVSEFRRPPTGDLEPARQPRRRAGNGRAEAH
jgi:hypothetical protein